MKTLKQYSEIFREARTTLDYWTELSIMEFASGLRALMKTQADLAEKMGVSPTYISNVLGCKDNLTIEQMNRIAAPLDAAVHVHVAKRNKIVTWKEEDSDATRLDAKPQEAADSNSKQDLHSVTVQTVARPWHVKRGVIAHREVRTGTLRANPLAQAHLASTHKVQEGSTVA